MVAQRTCNTAPEIPMVQLRSAGMREEIPMFQHLCLMFQRLDPVMRERSPKTRERIAMLRRRSAVTRKRYAVMGARFRRARDRAAVIQAASHESEIQEAIPPSYSKYPETSSSTSTEPLPSRNG